MTVFVPVLWFSVCAGGVFLTSPAAACTSDTWAGREGVRRAGRTTFPEACS